MNPIIFVVIVTCALIAGGDCQTSSCRAGDPILLVPGILGSQLSVRDSRPFSLCNTLGFFVGLWVDELRIPKVGCFSTELMLDFDQNTGRYFQRDSSNIEVNVPEGEFGDTSAVEDLSTFTGLIPYMEELVNYFVDRGYERNVNIRAAPYDWRFGPEELEKRNYYKQLRELIETMYRDNGNRKVTLVIHSMGGPTTLYFLNNLVDQAWKDQYIGNYVTLSGAWAGGNDALLYQISGVTAVDENTLGAFFGFVRFLSRTIRQLLLPIVRTFQSTSLLTPPPSVWGDTVLVTTPERSYTARDYRDLFSDINYPQGFAQFQGVVNVNGNFPAPNVPTHCFYGVGVDTPISYHYSKPFPEGTSTFPDITMATGAKGGDGTVPLLSSEVCLRWGNGNNGGRPFESRAFEGVDHMMMVTDQSEGGVLESIRDIVRAEKNQCRSLFDQLLDSLGDLEQV